MKRITTLALAVLLLVGITLVGCSNGGNTATASPKEALQEAFTKSYEMESSKFDGTVKLNLDMPDSVMSDPSAAMVLNMLNNAELTIRGTSQIDPMMAELFVTVRVTGDTEMAINLSMLINEEKMWIKVPNTPFLPLPEDMVGKYMEFDFQELSEMTGEEIDFSNQQQYQQLGTEMMEVFFGAFEEEDYFSIVTKEEGNVPEEVDANQVVKFELTNENLRPFVETFIGVLPDMLEKLTVIEDAGITQADIDELKAEIEAGAEDIQSTLDEVEESLNINDASIVTAIDKNGFMTYTDVNISVDITEDGETGTLGFSMVMNQTEINQDPEFEISEPGESEVIPFVEFMNTMMMSGF